MQNNRFAIFGASTTGKSTLAKLIFKKKIDSKIRDRFFVISTSSKPFEESDPVTKFSLKDLGFERLTFSKGQLEAINATPEDLDYKRIVHSAKRCVFVLESLTQEQMIEISSHLCEAIHDVGSAVIWIDEAMRFYPSQKTNEGIEFVVNAGAHKGVDSICLIQHGAQASKAIERSCADAGWIIAFRMTEPNQADRFGGYFPGKAEDGESYSDKLSSLPDYHFLWRDRKGEVDIFSNDELAQALRLIK